MQAPTDARARTRLEGVADRILTRLGAAADTDSLETKLSTIEATIASRRGSEALKSVKVVRQELHRGRPGGRGEAKATVQIRDARADALAERETAEGAPAQECGEPFNVKGHGSAAKKKDAIDAAHKDAQSTADLMCTDANCKTATFQRYESVDPVPKAGGGGYNVTTEEVYICQK
jgi:hypothetical protein